MSITIRPVARTLALAAVAAGTLALAGCAAPYGAGYGDGYGSGYQTGYQTAGYQGTYGNAGYGSAYGTSGTQISGTRCFSPILSLTYSRTASLSVSVVHRGSGRRQRRRMNSL